MIESVQVWLENVDLTTVAAIWGAVLATVLAIRELAEAWRERGRVEFRVSSAICYFEEWTQFDIDQLGSAPGPPGAEWPINAGDCKRTFVVLEFLLKNYHAEAVAIGRFRIADWMYADAYTPELYAPQRDYRAFDLLTGQPVGLDRIVQVPSKDSFGLRVEILDEVSKERECPRLCVNPKSS